MAEAGYYPLTIEQGTDVSLFFACKDAAGTLIDTAGYTARAQVRATYESTTTLLDMTTANGMLTVGIQGTAPDQWNVQMDIPHATTAALTDWGRGVWDLELVDTAGNVKRVLQGMAVLSREVTR